MKESFEEYLRSVESERFYDFTTEEKKMLLEFYYQGYIKGAEEIKDKILSNIK